MKNSISKSLFLTSAIALGAPTTGLADVSAQDVWSSWKAYSESFGQTLSVGSQEESGGTLTLHDVKMAFEFPDGNVSSTLSFLELKERGDGTVAITMSPDLPLSMSVDPADDDAVDFAIILRQTGMSIVASGDPDNISFDYLASEISVSLDQLIVDGQAMEMNTDITLNGVDGGYSVDRSDGLSYTSQMNADLASYDIGFADPEGGESFQMTGTVNGLQSSSNAIIPEGFDSSDPATIFGGAFSMDAKLTTGQSNGTAEFVDDDEGFSLITSTEGSELNVAIDQGSLGYGGRATGLNYEIKSPQIPLPEVTVGFSEVAFNLLMPLAKSDAPQDFGFLMRLAGFEVNDMIWNMLDPGQIMPRGPATIGFDVSGSMNWLLDITDPEQVEGFEDEFPGELYSLTISDIEVSALGAEVTATGAFEFDNSDLTTFEGLPAPTGQIDVNINGVNGLMDRLTQMGFLPSDQAMGARMMLGLFARPAGGEDQLTSTIEVQGNGSVFANGQQLK